MATYVALLRGVNVGGKTLAMTELRRVFVDLGHKEVRTYIQSGNVVFDAAGSAARVVAELERRIAGELALDTTILLRSAKDLARVVEKNPFLRRGADPGALHVTFLAAAPGAGASARLDAPGAEPDELQLVDREIYIHCPNGYGRTKLNNSFIERRVGVAATTRNWRTVEKLLAMATA